MNLMVQITLSGERQVFKIAVNLKLSLHSTNKIYPSSPIRLRDIATLYW